MKKVFSGIIFFLILIIILVGLSFLLSPNYLLKDYVVDNKSDISTRLAKEEPGSLDIIVLGDSESYTSISPPELWKDYGYTTYNFGLIGATLSDIKETYKSILSTQQPKVVLFETNCLYRVDNAREEADNIITDLIHKVLPVTMYHDNWKMLFKDSRKGYYKGFTVSHTIDPAENKKYMIPTDEEDNVISDNLESLREINDMCNASGGKLILYSVPSQSNYNYAKHNALSKLAKELDVDYVDMNHVGDEIGIDYTTDTRDGGDHLNVYGATKSTAYIGKYLHEHYDISDRRDTDVAPTWNEMLKEYEDDTLRI